MDKEPTIREGAGMDKVPSIRNVAQAAGVSTATVSRTLNRPSAVAEATRRAVFAAIRTTGYQVNEAARNFRRQRTGSIVTLVPNLANPFFSQIFAGLAQVLTPAGYNLLVADTQAGPDADERLERLLGSGQCDGVVLLDGGLRPELVTQLPERGGPPLLMACEWVPGVPLPQVRIDNREGAAMAVRHLAELGHQEIGHLTGPQGNVLTESRLDGWRAALAERGLPVREEWILEGDFTLDSGAFAARRWLAMRHPPRAVVCGSDEMAIGFIGALGRAGAKVPRDVSVVGFDDVELAAHAMPRLTTIRQPRTEIGIAAATSLLKLIDGGQVSETLLPIRLVRRDSTAAPRR